MNPYSLKQDLSHGLNCDILFAGSQNGHHLGEPINNQKNVVIVVLG